MELAFICTGKKSISVESAQYFLNVEFVLGNVVRRPQACKVMQLASPSPSVVEDHVPTLPAAGPSQATCQLQFEGPVVSGDKGVGPGVPMTR